MTCYLNGPAAPELMHHLLFVALGGALGASLRYGAGVLAATFWRYPLPLATWTVNLAGCLLIGLLGPVLTRIGAPGSWYAFLIVGFLGSLTTFSTFSLETVVLWQQGTGMTALVNAAGSVMLGIGCVWLGLQIGRLIAA